MGSAGHSAGTFTSIRNAISRERCLQQSPHPKSIEFPPRLFRIGLNRTTMPAICVRATHMRFPNVLNLSRIGSQSLRNEFPILSSTTLPISLCFAHWSFTRRTKFSFESESRYLAQIFRNVCTADLSHGDRSGRLESRQQKYVIRQPRTGKHSLERDW